MISSHTNHPDLSGQVNGLPPGAQLPKTLGWGLLLQSMLSNFFQKAYLQDYWWLM